MNRGVLFNDRTPIVLCEPYISLLKTLLSLVSLNSGWMNEYVMNVQRMMGERVSIYGIRIFFKPVRSNIQGVQGGPRRLTIQSSVFLSSAVS